MSSTAWQLQKAKNKFNRLIKLASGGAAQVVTVHGKPAAGKLSRLLLKPGLAGDELKVVRDYDTGRDMSL